jgi:hypothetical protein
MRAIEFLMEFKRWKTKHGTIDDRQAQATPGAYTNDADRYYGLYRASMFMARAPGNDDDIDIDSVAATAYIGAYTDADKQKIDAAHKALGIKTKTQARGPSEEMEDTNTQSPITAAKWQRKK